ncbi:MAG: DUF4406 domain-containing protein [Prevotella sp.]|nr:DUF4406 domain-containing protein [Prevotella sp.]
MSKKVYISGKIGEEVLSEATREKFAKAEKWLKAQGYDVFNPTTSGLGTAAERAAKKYATTFYKEILLLDIVALQQCDIICLLPDWCNSPGAQAELYFAKAIGLKVKQLISYGDKIFNWV